MLAADASMVILRVVHIVTGVIWVGSLFVVVVFVQPSATALGPAGAPFMSELRRRRFVDVVFIDALFTIAAGSFLYWHDWHTHPSFGDWIGWDVGLPGLISGLSLPLFYVAFLNRSGPGTVCTSTATSRSCVDGWSPWPWLATGIVLLVSGCVWFAIANRRRGVAAP